MTTNPLFSDGEAEGGLSPVAVSCGRRGEGGGEGGRGRGEGGGRGGEDVQAGNTLVSDAGGSRVTAANKH